MGWSGNEFFITDELIIFYHEAPQGDNLGIFYFHSFGFLYCSIDIFDKKYIIVMVIATVSSYI